MNSRNIAAGVLVAMFGAARAAVADPAVATHIVVVDPSGAPVSAEVFSTGRSGRISLGNTDDAGQLVVTLTGPTTLVARRGTRASTPVSVGSTGDVKLVLPLAEIAHVRATPANPGEPFVTESSAAATAFDDVAAARSLVANYRSHSEGGSGQETLNGVPLDLPTGPHGGAGNAPSVPSDLIHSFSATQADDGTITPNYHLLSPTAQTRVTFTRAFGADDLALWKFGLSGTAHKLGFAVEAATGGDDGVLAGATFADASGRVYDHSTAARHTDVSLSLSQAIGTTQVNAAGFATRRTSNDVDPTMPGSVALGFGPGNVTTTTSGFEYVVASQTHGRDSYHVVDSRFAGGSADDAADAVLAGVPMGSVSGYRYSGAYDELSLTRSFGNAALTAKATQTQTSTTGYLADSPFASADAIRSGQRTLGFDYSANSGSRNYGIGIDEAQRLGDFAGSSLEARAHAKVLVRGTSIRLSALHAQAQTQEAYSADAYNLSAPSGAAFTCDSPSATVTGPSQTSGRHPQADTIDASVHRDFARGASVTAGGFVSAGHDMLVFPTSQLTSALDPAYRAQLAQNFGVVCPGKLLATSDIFVAQYQSVSHLDGREWFVDGSLPLGILRAELSYETYSLFVPAGSYTPLGVTDLVPGAQIAGVPLHRANALLSYARPHLLVALALQYSSANNSANLPGHVTAALGAQERLGRSTLSVSIQNLFNADRGTFATSRYAVPLSSTGAPIPTLATPIRRIWSLRYALSL